MSFYDIVYIDFILHTYKIYTYISYIKLYTIFSERSLVCFSNEKNTTFAEMHDSCWHKNKDKAA